MRPLLAALSVALFIPVIASAQALGGLGDMSGSAFSVSVAPQYPPPYGSATILPLSGTVDLTNATLAVSVGDKEIYRGAAHSFSVPLGRAGSITNVKMTIFSGGASYAQTVSIQPQDVVLVAEPISSSPPLYQGKPSVPLEGDVRVVAVANLVDSGGKTSSPTTYSYAWTVDGVQVANSSGIGKSSIIVASPLQYRAGDVSVAVTNSSGNLVGGAELSLSAVEPSVRIYENDPLLGIRYDRALSSSFAIGGTEATLYAAPFSLPTSSGAPLLQWFLNGDAVQTGPSITLRPTGSGQGSASLSLTASAGQFTTVAKSLSLTFGASPGSNFFGL